MFLSDEHCLSEPRSWSLCRLLLQFTKMTSAKSREAVRGDSAGMGIVRRQLLSECGCMDARSGRNYQVSWCPTCRCPFDIALQLI
jgi:hypothetical protein